jgi:hypothetical protein
MPCHSTRIRVLRACGLLFLPRAIPCGAAPLLSAAHSHGISRADIADSSLSCPSSSPFLLRSSPPSFLFSFPSSKPYTQRRYPHTQAPSPALSLGLALPYGVLTLSCWCAVVCCVRPFRAARHFGSPPLSCVSVCTSLPLSFSLCRCRRVPPSAQWSCVGLSALCALSSPLLLCSTLLCSPLLCPPAHSSPLSSSPAHSLLCCLRFQLGSGPPPPPPVISLFFSCPVTAAPPAPPPLSSLMARTGVLSARVSALLMALLTKGGHGPSPSLSVCSAAVPPSLSLLLVRVYLRPLRLTQPCACARCALRFAPLLPISLLSSPPPLLPFPSHASAVCAAFGCALKRFLCV